MSFDFPSQDADSSPDVFDLSEQISAPDLPTGAWWSGAASGTSSTQEAAASVARDMLRRGARPRVPDLVWEQDADARARALSARHSDDFEVATSVEVDPDDGKRTGLVRVRVGPGPTAGELLDLEEALREDLNAADAVLRTSVRVLRR